MSAPSIVPLPSIQDQMHMSEPLADKRAATILHEGCHTFQIVGWGRGLFGESSKGEEDGDGGGATGTTWNLENPMRRDTVTVPAFSHVVIRFVADNPGLWALHCHVAWHMEGGRFVSLAERPGDLVELVDKMDPETRRLSQSFCGMRGDQQASGADDGEPA
ncbi:hypothetical protein DL764_010084 [Monosporascus ibericus]|uniref:Plastocyanin-like domain-containing protein n=1 Tax=Monosporascus ibericus TaxID=155417 RepID=A0A4Q4STG5_9PEZI|nr:hypothetical protein DL764_010084 [Monosporascus ibericus]